MNYANSLTHEGSANPDKTLAQEKIQPVAPCNLTVGWGDWPPYQMSGPAGEPHGIQITLLKEIAQLANCHLKFKLQTFNQNQLALKNGTIDMTFDTTVSPDRQTYAYFSIPYRNEVMVLYVRPDYFAACSLKRVAEFIQDGFRLGVTTGNIYGDTIAEIQQNPKLDQLLVYSEKDTEHFDLFKQGVIDGFIEDPAVLGFKLRQDPDIGPLTACKIAVNSSPVALMFSKKTVSLEQVRKFDEAINAIRQTPDYQKVWAW